ncbi:sulfur carrier protein ThiS [Vibrio panuliri]|uniref:Thiamine biosynthesis protein ThiS n=1 Tax=Vibrio panuliri TaxID=1381081 RepID=A0A1Q9HNV2_9VIBR|nr:sulfur carrier protein ThiS [Vibrio panuliri]KAB1460369.1 sulfur carrier protein ThiS [Vibrio panuliri]OLQ84099.1 thiamine biosynthesis protein ThiS [Vibrio panuliri]OLQ92497.1 thiamine biosynthesis protein ThiS [Vibrio panuliri]
MTEITITINQQVQSIKAESNLEQVIDLLSLPQQGCVFAINNQIIPRTKWSATTLSQGDAISLFQAIAGG